MSPIHQKCTVAAPNSIGFQPWPAPVICGLGVGAGPGEGTLDRCGTHGINRGREGEKFVEK